MTFVLLFFCWKQAFTGDTLFIGSVGRPDLVSAPKNAPIKDANEMRKVMASKMYQTLIKKIFDEKGGLPDATHVHPAHGAGSPCGANLRYVGFSIIFVHPFCVDSVYIELVCYCEIVN